MTHYQEQLTSLLDNIIEENEDIRSLRLNAFDSFKRLGFPTKKMRIGDLQIFLKFKMVIFDYQDQATYLIILKVQSF